MILQSLLVIMALVTAQGETTFTVEYNSTRYEYHITDQDLQATPAWPASQDNPPLSARSAIDIASKQLATLLPDGKDWRLYEVTLRLIQDRWVYLLEFLEPLRGNGGGQQLSTGFEVVVLMSGVAVTPRILK